MSECIFCRIINKQLPAKLLYEDDQILAFQDINPQAPTHIIVIPKIHAANLSELKDFSIISQAYHVVMQLAESVGIERSGFRVVLNQGRDAGQAVEHLHFHLLGGREFIWPPG
ncbi:histidine triad nucleotide-binding protein [candidate division WOR-1 bacterium RIFOXYB2_FULL_48_7]|uniref:Histidine triad nucleotide-binding protein n=1 Tax=candidate division WOR-1 bacterium RIFOXYB2_FULL_48_7 TaxID=1802583 RepID=A0A1F4TS09_UNCSA|nr:MAG: histidine triad nucleotide-binding protein [candidate division WOR-1 bacterium RIFOXYB2_FULL_48_7]